MNRTQLQNVFESENVDPQAYDFNGSNIGEQYVLEPRAGGWSV